MPIKPINTTILRPIISASLTRNAEDSQSPIKYNDPKRPILKSSMQTRFIEVIQLTKVSDEP